MSVFQIAVPHRRSFCRAYDLCKHHVRQEERRRVESQYPFSARLYSAMFSKVIFWGERRRHCLRKKDTIFSVNGRVALRDGRSDYELRYRPRMDRSGRHGRLAYRHSLLVRNFRSSPLILSCSKRQLCGIRIHLLKKMTQADPEYHTPFRSSSFRFYFYQSFVRSISKWCGIMLLLHCAKFCRRRDVFDNWWSNEAFFNSRNFNAKMWWPCTYLGLKLVQLRTLALFLKDKRTAQKAFVFRSFLS